MQYTVRRLGKNVRLVTVPGVEILISYEVPVALQIQSPDVAHPGQYVRTNVRWSRSTENQLSKWILRTPVTVHQSQLDELLTDITGDYRLRETRNTCYERPRANTNRVLYDAHTLPGERHLVVQVYRRRYR